MSKNNLPKRRCASNPKNNPETNLCLYVELLRSPRTRMREAFSPF
jgi:hypothetical protein